jgi:hypothetical protein
MIVFVAKDVRCYVEQAWHDFRAKRAFRAFHYLTYIHLFILPLSIYTTQHTLAHHLLFVLFPQTNVRSSQQQPSSFVQLPDCTQSSPSYSSVLYQPPQQ